MDLSSILASGSTERREEQRQESDEASKDARSGAITSIPTATGRGAPSLYQQQQHAPLHPQPQHPGGSTRSIPLQTVALTPLATSPHPGQYPYPPQPSQSPASRASQGPPYRPSDVPTPITRPPSHGQQFAPPPLPHQTSSGLGTVHNYGMLPHSPTPSSHKSHTPLSNRQSPMTLMNQPPGPQAQHQRPQSNVSMVHPSLQHQRSANINDLHSPSHHRTLSASSSGIPSNSPAHRHMHISNQMGSPYTATSPQIHRSVSDFTGQGDRERSVSVSPKTRIIPRPPSMGSRHSSQNDLHSARSSVQMGGPMPTGSPSHAMHPQRMTPIMQQSASQSHQIGGGEVSQASPTQYPLTSVPSGNPASDNISPLAQMKSAQQPVLHRAQKMTMDHLITPTNETPPTPANGGAFAASQSAERTPTEIRSAFPGPSPHLSHSAGSNTSSADYFQGPNPNRQSQNMVSPSRSQSMKEQPSPWPAQAPANAQGSAGPPPDRRAPLKRQADHDLSGPPPKQARMQRRQERPAWAFYSKHNSLSQGQQARPNGAMDKPSAPRQPVNASHANGGPVSMPSAPQMASGAAHDLSQPPWLQNPPLDMDLINARNILGQWEKSFMWNTPLPSLLEGLQDWMFLALDGLGDVGWDPKEGTLEIEAKIGTLLDRDDNRCNLPVATATLINPEANRNFRFESRMNEVEHQAMNNFLNQIIRDTMSKGRVPMSYKHLYEIDSFRHLSPAGLRAIPASLQRRQSHRDPTLRTTTELDKSGNAVGIKARIVKINLDNIHIYNPRHRYDCRISLNLEVNLNQPHIDPAELIIEPTEGKPTEPDRRKDRVSYTHLAYSIDLTKVIIDGIAPKHELELEVDANLLRQQHDLLKKGQPNAFADILSGFLDNATYLMRHR